MWDDTPAIRSIWRRAVGLTPTPRLTPLSCFRRLARIRVGSEGWLRLHLDLPTARALCNCLGLKAKGQLSPPSTELREISELGKLEPCVVMLLVMKTRRIQESTNPTRAVVEEGRIFARFCYFLPFLLSKLWMPPLPLNSIMQ